MTVLDVLRRARSLYEANPSHSRELAVPRPAVCAALAIDEAGDGDNKEAYRAFLTANGVVHGELWRWNADHSTAEVLAGFDRAIASVSPDGHDAP